MNHINIGGFRNLNIPEQQVVNITQFNGIAKDFGGDCVVAYGRRGRQTMCAVFPAFGEVMLGSASFNPNDSKFDVEYGKALAFCRAVIRPEYADELLLEDRGRDEIEITFPKI